MKEPTSVGERVERPVLNLGGAVLGVWLGLAGLGFALSELGPARWFFVVPLATLGVWLLARVLPRLLGGSAAADDEAEGELSAPELGERRIRCPCCGCPSLSPGIPDQSCVACEWLVEGLPGRLEAPAEALAAARESFRRYLSVYAPDARPEWSPDPPSADELALRRELLQLYAGVLADPGDGRPWWEIVKLEKRIKELELDYSLAVEGEAEEQIDSEEIEPAEEEPTALPEPPVRSRRELP